MFSFFKQGLDVLQIILIAILGAILGEMKREIDDKYDVVIYKFIINFAGSAFLGFLIGYFAQGVLNSTVLAITGAGIGGYVGQNKVSKFLWNIYTKNFEKLMNKDDSNPDSDSFDSTSTNYCEKHNFLNLMEKMQIITEDEAATIIGIQLKEEMNDPDNIRKTGEIYIDDIAKDKESAQKYVNIILKLQEDNDVFEALELLDNVRKNNSRGDKS